MSMFYFQDVHLLLVSEILQLNSVSNTSSCCMFVTFSFVNPFFSNSLKTMHLLTGMVDEGSLSTCKCLCI